MGKEKTTWIKTSYALDGNISKVQNSAATVDLQIFHHDQA